MTNVTCCDLSCGVVFGVPDHVYAQARSSKDRWFHCPNGHKQHYVETDADRLRRMVEELERRLADARGSRDRAYRLVACWKGQVTRLKRGGR